LTANICRNAAAIAFRLGGWITIGMPYWPQNVYRNGVPVHSGTTTPLAVYGESLSLLTPPLFSYAVASVNSVNYIIIKHCRMFNTVKVSLQKLGGQIWNSYHTYTRFCRPFSLTCIRNSLAFWCSQLTRRLVLCLGLLLRNYCRKRGKLKQQGM